MSISTRSSMPEMTRICLVGPVAQDATTVAAAQTFQLPVVTSDTGAEYLATDGDDDDDDSLNTVFVLNDFEGPVYDAINRAKQRILGPPALQQAVRFSEGLTWNIRPIYNYCMRGVVTCFTGFRKKDELTNMIGLIHSMGGSVRGDMGTKVTHLICNYSSGRKYRYATTFRLAIIRMDWVMEAWKNRHDPNFSATAETFINQHRVKVFEGHKVCFFGFQEDERQHMIDVLKTNGGIPTELDDPECSHVVMPNGGAHFVEATMPACTSSPTKSGPPATPPPQDQLEFEGFTGKQQQPCGEETIDSGDQETDDRREVLHTGGCNVILPVLPEENESAEGMVEGNRFGRRPRHGGEHLMSVAENDNNHNQFAERRPCRASIVVSPGMQYIDEEPEVENEIVGTSVTATCRQADGVVLTSGEANEFLNPNNISPILKPGSSSGEMKQKDVIGKGEGKQLHQKDDVDDDIDDDDMDDYVIASREAYKRRRTEDSFDDQSMLSVDISIASSVMYGGGVCGGSAKKPKLTRTGSITRGIRRSMSFAAIKTPIKSMLRSRRNSVDPNASITSVTSIETTFNESIKKPVKEKLRSIRDKITKGGRKDTPKSIKSKGVGLLTSTNLDSLKKVCHFKTGQEVGSAATEPHTPEQPRGGAERSEVDFKTPVAPPFGGFNGGDSSSKMVTRSRGKPAPSALHQRHSIATGTAGAATAVTPLFANDEEMPMETATNAKTSGATTSPTAMVYGGAVSTDADMIPVVDEHAVHSKLEAKNKNTHIVKADWFWYTIQAGYANEIDFLFADYLESIAHTPVVDRRDSLPVSFNKRKRKRLSQRIPAEGTPLSVGKRRSSVSDAGLLSVSGSFLDCTNSPDKHEASKRNVISEAGEAPLEQQPAKKQTKRYHYFTDFFHTESNYVGILESIVKLFKEPLEEMVESDNALLNKSELRSIFGNFLPIYEVHKGMLARLQAIHGNWSEEAMIGQIVLDYREDLLKAYPPYVNFFEQMKETLVQCDTSNPRFHAFLKINQSKPECGRQSLQDLMIRPVQRLPSISLLLKDIFEQTAEANADKQKLKDALTAIREVMTYINEDKRKTEGQMALFDIFKHIDECPFLLVSSHRKFVSRCEVTALSDIDNLIDRGDPLVLFLFNDTLMVCKKRSRAFNNAKSPNTNTLNLTRSSSTGTKPYKHLKSMPLSTVRLVVNIVDSPRAFLLNCREMAPNAKDCHYSFNMADEEQDKLVYLRSLSKQMAENACRPDAAHFLINSTAEEVDIDVSDINVGTLAKAFKFASKTRIRVGRAFSFNKTPSKLKRAVSTMMTSPFGSTQSLTPASQLAQMKLASCTNLNEVGEEAAESNGTSPSGASTANVLVAPLSVQPTRKNKNPPVSIVTLRHL
ncbi:protein ECT2 [Anopheles bellator]|uniref:protein ECT2 n=1 Tax=Anopheles bellator TaxID=139047 RepID=UPI002647491C|nr:protein ECT2 [Anopheles bellator]